MTPETGLAIFGLWTLLLLGVEIFFTYGAQGFAYGFSANRPDVTHGPLAKRIKNAYQNQIESAAYGVPVLAAVALAGLNRADVHLAILVFICARIAFSLLYYTGVTFIRVPAFLAGTLSTLYLLYAFWQAVAA